jgi:hypothetical protein
MFSASGINYGSRIASFIDSLAQVLWRIPMVGLSRVASWRWLLPLASVLTPASVVIVVASLRSRIAAYRSTVRLAAAFVHVFFSDSGHRVFSIKLNPCPLRVTNCLAQVWIMTAFEYGSYPGDVGHGSSEAPLIMPANSASSSRCIDRMRSLTLLRRTAQALFLALRTSRSVSFSWPALAVASSSDIISSTSLGEMPSSSPSLS